MNHQVMCAERAKLIYKSHPVGKSYHMSSSVDLLSVSVFNSLAIQYPYISPLGLEMLQFFSQNEVHHIPAHVGYTGHLSSSYSSVSLHTGHLKFASCL